MFFKTESWNFQHLIEKEFIETSRTCTLLDTHALAISKKSSFLLYKLFLVICNHRFASNKSNHNHLCIFLVQYYNHFWDQMDPHLNGSVPLQTENILAKKSTLVIFDTVQNDILAPQNFFAVTNWVNFIL